MEKYKRKKGSSEDKETLTITLKRNKMAN